MSDECYIFMYVSSQESPNGTTVDLERCGGREGREVRGKDREASNPSCTKKRRGGGSPLTALLLSPCEVSLCVCV